MLMTWKGACWVSGLELSGLEGLRVGGLGFEVWGVWGVWGFGLGRWASRHTQCNCLGRARLSH